MKQELGREKRTVKRQWQGTYKKPALRKVVRFLLPASSYPLHTSQSVENGAARTEKAFLTCLIERISMETILLPDLDAQQGALNS
ncbi:MAG: hypothetical protein ABSG91_15285 [Syntrophobacteraceae bacterium]|jgi:hypothetical protein